MFLKLLVSDHERYGLPHPPETFPKQPRVTAPAPMASMATGSGCRDGTRRKRTGPKFGTAPTGSTASRPWTPPCPHRRPGGPALEDCNMSVLTSRIQRYMARLPNLGEGQGRDDKAYTFATFLVRDLRLPDAEALSWLERWDAGNSPPKGTERPAEDHCQAHTYGQHPYAGLQTPPSANGQPAAAAEPARTFTLGTLTLRPEQARRVEGSGKLQVPIAVLQGGREVNRYQLPETISTRNEIATELKILLGPDGPSIDTIKSLFGEILCYAAARLDRAEKAGRPHSVGDRSDEGPRKVEPLVSNDPGNVVERSARLRDDPGCILGYLPEWLIDECSRAIDAPFNIVGEISRRELIGIIKRELEVTYATLEEILPPMSGMELAGKSALGKDFWEAIVKTWHSLSTAESVKGPEGEQIPVRASLVRRVLRGGALPFLRGQRTPGKREKWQLIQNSFLAHWRPGLTRDGEVVVWLAMHWELGFQTKTIIPGVKDQRSLNYLGELFDVFDPDPPVPRAVSGGKMELAVLTRERAGELLDQPDDAAEENFSDSVNDEAES